MKNEVLNENTYYEGLIQSLYGGNDGCFCLFMTFFFQHNQSKKFFPELESNFDELEKLELENCKMLAEILVEMGADAKFFSKSKTFLSGYNVDYSKNISKIFLSDIEKLELHLIEIKSIILKVRNKRIKEKLNPVLENKKKSLKILRENYFKYNLKK